MVSLLKIPANLFWKIYPKSRHVWSYFPSSRSKFSPEGGKVILHLALRSKLLIWTLIKMESFENDTISWADIADVSSSEDTMSKWMPSSNLLDFFATEVNDTNVLRIEHKMDSTNENIGSSKELHEAFTEVFNNEDSRLNDTTKVVAYANNVVLL